MITITMGNKTLTAGSRQRLCRKLIDIITHAPPAREFDVQGKRDVLLGKKPLLDVGSTALYDWPATSEAHYLRRLLLELEASEDPIYEQDPFREKRIYDDTIHTLACLAWDFSEGMALIDELPGLSDGDGGVWSLSSGGFIEETEWGFVRKCEHELLIDAQALGRTYHRTLREAYYADFG